nr:hypothetical protein [Tanacetum cinerariifolium]
MDDENIPAQAPTRYDDQIFPFAAWVPIGKSNYAIQTFLTDKANLGSLIKKGRKDKPHVIPYYRFMKLIICHLGRIHNIHQRSASPFHLTEEDFRLGNLKFVSKGEADEVFGMPIPNELISNNIRNTPYYNAYLEMVAKHDRKLAAEKEGKMKTASAKQPKSNPAMEKSSKPAPAPKPKATKERPFKASTAKPPKPKPTKEKSTKTTPTQHAGKGKIAKVRKVKSPFQVVDEPDEEPAVEATQPLPVVERKGKAIKTNSGGGTVILHIDEEQGNDVDDQVNLEEKTNEVDQGQAKSDPGRTPESRPPPEHVVMDEDQAGPNPEESRGDLVGPDPEPTHDEFMADMYPKVQESLKFLADEHVILEDPISSTGTLSSIKNLEDAYAIWDQFINYKSTEDEPEKPNVEAKVVSMVTVLIYQASSLVPSLSTPVPVTDLLPLKPASSTIQEPIFTATITTTTTTLPPLPQQQSTTESELAARVTSLEKKLSDLEQKNKTLDNTSQNLGSRVFTLELRDLPHKIDEAVRESVKKARMFETGTYKSLLEHVALYEALEASMERAKRDEYLTEKDKSHKRRCDDQDPPHPSPDSDLSKRRRHDTGASGYCNISDSKDTYSAHLPKIKQRPKWLKPVTDDERPATPELAWVIPTSHIPDAVNNWANALATTYQALTENS